MLRVTMKPIAANCALFVRTVKGEACSLSIYYLLKFVTGTERAFGEHGGEVG
jgi:hypothetical protein